MEFNYIIVMITAPNQESAKEIASALVEQKLAACVNIITPVHSIYRWEGHINDEPEVLLLVKTRAEIFEAKVVPAVIEVHPYDVPEIIALPILMGSSRYLDWIAAETI